MLRYKRVHSYLFYNASSLLSRTAPGTYSPEKVNLEKGPQYSLTGKSRIEKYNDTPGT